MALRFGYFEEESKHPERNPAKTSDLYNAVDSVLDDYYSKDGKQHGKIDAVKSLQEFWQMKLPQQDSKVPSTDLITYEFEQEDRSPYICYVTLPGGSCFGSFEYCKTKDQAKCCAAKIALMNSVLNEHPSRCITTDFIDKATREAENIEERLACKNSVSPNRHHPSVTEAYRFMLTSMKGKSLLEFQELMTIFQLLNWNGSLRVLQNKGLSRQHVLAHYKSRTIDEDIRGQMALDWVSRAQKTPEIIAECYEQACQELNEFRLRGRELRFIKEKMEILGLALQQLGEA